MILPYRHISLSRILSAVCNLLALRFAGRALQTIQRGFDKRRTMTSPWCNAPYVTCSAWTWIRQPEWRGLPSGWRRIAASGWGEEKVVFSGFNSVAHHWYSPKLQRMCTPFVGVGWSSPKHVNSIDSIYKAALEEMDFRMSFVRGED